MKQPTKYKPGDLVWYHNYTCEKPSMVMVLEYVEHTKHNETCYKVLFDEKVGYVLPQFLGNNKNGCRIDSWGFSDQYFANPRSVRVGKRF